MKLFEKFARPSAKAAADITPEKAPHTAGMTLENQNGRITEFRDIDIEDYLYDMFSDEEQFVTLAREKAVYGVRFVQACQARGAIDVQLGIEETGRTRLVEKYCSERECMDIFLHFYDTARVEDIEHYKPVEFLKAP